jgi:hypothetical protein
MNEFTKTIDELDQKGYNSIFVPLSAIKFLSSFIIVRMEQKENWDLINLKI